MKNRTLQNKLYLDKTYSTLKANHADLDQFFVYTVYFGHCVLRNIKGLAFQELFQRELTPPRLLRISNKLQTYIESSCSAVFSARKKVRAADMFYLQGNR